MKPKELDKEITEILMCMYNSGDTTNCLADIKKLILEAEIKKGLVDFQIYREELTQQRTELLEEYFEKEDNLIDKYANLKDDNWDKFLEARCKLKINLLNKKNETK